MEMRKLAVYLWLSSMVALCHAMSQVMPCTVPMCAAPPPDCHYLSDANGCPTCNLECNDPACPILLECPKPCYNGHVKDSYGCNTCDCKPGCLERTCGNTDCPNGFLQDSTGCPTCACKPKPLPCHRFLNCPQNGVCPNECACKPDCYVRGSNNGVDKLEVLRAMRKFWDAFLKGKALSAA